LSLCPCSFIKFATPQRVSFCVGDGVLVYLPFATKNRLVSSLDLCVIKWRTPIRASWRRKKKKLSWDRRCFLSATRQWLCLHVEEDNKTDRIKTGQTCKQSALFVVNVDGSRNQTVFFCVTRGTDGRSVVAPKFCDNYELDLSSSLCAVHFWVELKAFCISYE
jgi:hypothetical protein